MGGIFSRTQASIEMNQIWTDLDNDTILSIGAVLPPDRVTKWKLLAKDYNSIISNPGFQRLYFAHHSNRPHLLLIELLSTRLGQQAQLVDPIDFTRRMVDVPTLVGDESQLIGCHRGLIAIMEKKTEVHLPANVFRSRNHSFRLWNPWVQKDVSVKLVTDPEDFDCQGNPIFGLACDDSSDGYKFVIAFNKPGLDLIQILMLSFKSRQVHLSQQNGLQLPPFIHSAGNTVKGLPHWVLRHPAEIYRFNQSTMEIEKIAPPTQMGSHDIAGFGNLQDNLSVITRSNSDTTFVVVWLQNSLPGWTKLYSIPLFGVQAGPFFPVLSTGRVFYGATLQNLICFDGDKTVDPGWTSPWNCLLGFSCQRTLVSPLSTELCC